MALDPKLIAQLKKDLKEINKLYKDIGKTPLTVDFNTAGLDEAKLIKTYLKDAREENELLFGSFRDVTNEINELFSGLNSITDEIKGQKQGYDLAKKAVNSITNTLGKVKDIQDGITKANSTDLKNLQDKVLAERKNLEESQRLLEEKQRLGKASEKEIATLENINGLLADQDGLFGDIAQTLSTIIANEEKVEEITGNLGVAVEGLSKGLQKAGLGALEQRLGLGDALESTKDMVRANDGNVSNLKAASHLAGQLGKNFIKSLDPATLVSIAIQEVVKAFKLIDRTSGEVAKNFGISAEEGRALVASSADAAALSGDLLVSTKDVVAAQISLNEQFGTSVKFSSEFAANFAKIQERTGLSAESMGLFAEQALIAGEDVEDQLISITAVTQEMSAQSGVMMSNKSIQEGLKELSASQRLNLRLSSEEMARQVFQSKLLGISQSQLENTAQSLLDFESSIGAEMEAELLTGKQLNLEEARRAALMNDQETLAREISKNVGSAADFQNMNAIQQQALAKALGMSKDELAEILITEEKNQAIRKAGFKDLSDAQKQYNEALEAGVLTEELKQDLAKAGVLAQLESATAQDKLNAATEKFTDLFIQLVDPLMPIIDALMAVLDPLFAILSPILKLVGDVIGLIMKGLMPAINAIKGLLDNITKTFKDTFGGINDIIAGIVNGDFGMILDGFKKVAEGAIRFITMPFQFLTDLVIGTINSTIKGFNKIPGVNIGTIDTPDLANIASSAIGLAKGGIVTKPTMAMVGEGGEPEAVVPLSRAPQLGFGGNGNNETNALLRELIAAVKSGGDVYMDGAKVGKSIALATSRIG